jgi:transketolase
LRQAFIDTLCRLAAEDERIVLLTGDLGFMVMEPFRDRFPERFFNAGVAEQNMIGMATGLAEAGLRPYAYSIAPFASLRPFEFIRNGPVLHQLPVRVVGMGMGFEYGHAGPTHYAIEDVAALRTLPGLTVVVPADGQQAASAVRATAGMPGPVYYSLGKDDRLSIQGLDGRFALGRVDVVLRGGDVAIVSMGSITAEAVRAAELLAERRVNATVAVVSSFNPDADEDLARILAGIPLAVSVEAQTISGGLGAFVAAVIASRRLDCRWRALAVTRPPDGTSGSQPDRWRAHGLDRTAIVESVLAALAGSAAR